MAAKKNSSLGNLLSEILPSPTAEEARGVPREQNQESGMRRNALHSLSQKEIDRRIERLTSAVAAALEPLGLETEAGLRARAPRWVSAAELVARVRPFLVYN